VSAYGVRRTYFEITGWAGKKRLQSLSIPDVEGRKMSKAEESEAGCARE
jgi:hypothetical protein